MKNLIFVVIVLILFAVVVKGEVVTPMNNEIIESDFYITVKEPNVSQVQAKIVGYPWVSLEQISGDTWSVRTSISNFSDGDYILSVKYSTDNSSVFYSPINLKIVRPAPTPAPTPAPPLKNMTVIGLSPGNYSNQTRMWVSIMDTNDSSAVNATVDLNNPDPVISWVAQNGLMKIDFSSIVPDSYLVRIRASNYHAQQFFINISPPPAPKISVSGFHDIVESGESENLWFTPEDVTLIFQYYNGTGITHNSTNYLVNTSNLSDGDYKLLATKDGYENWTGTFSVLHPRTPTPAATPSVSSTPQMVYVPELGRNLTVDQRDGFYLGLNSRSTPAPTPPVIQVNASAASPSTQSPSDSGIGPYLLVFGLVGTGAYLKFVRKDPKPDIPADLAHTDAGAADKDRIADRIADSFNPVIERVKIINVPVKCDQCDYTVEMPLPLGMPLTDIMKKMCLAEHVQKEHTEKE